MKILKKIFYLVLFFLGAFILQWALVLLFTGEYSFLAGKYSPEGRDTGAIIISILISVSLMLYSFFGFNNK